MKNYLYHFCSSSINCCSFLLSVVRSATCLVQKPKALNYWSSKHHYASIFGRVVTKVNDVKIFTTVYHLSHSLNESRSTLSLGSSKNYRSLFPKGGKVKVSFSHFMHNTSKLTVYNHHYHNKDSKGSSDLSNIILPCNVILGCNSTASNGA